MKASQCVRPHVRANSQRGLVASLPPFSTPSTAVHLRFLANRTSLITLPRLPSISARMGLHSSFAPRDGSAAKSDQSAAASEEVTDDEETDLDAEQDEAEATALVQRAAGLVDDTQRWAPVLELPIESFLNKEQAGPIGTVTLNPNIFMVPIRRDILHRVVVWQLAKRRQGTHKSKSRAEVSGGGRKPRPQKGSGRSRQGSIRSPLWVGGGHAHAKRPRDYYFPLLKKVRKLGLKTALSLKFAQGKLKIVRSTQVDEAKTRNLAHVVEGKEWSKALVIDGKNVDDSFRKASNNLQSVKVLPVGGCNVYDILNHDLLVLSLEAMEYLEEFLLEPEAPAFYAHPSLPSAKEEEVIA